MMKYRSTNRRDSVYRPQYSNRQSSLYITRLNRDAGSQNAPEHSISQNYINANVAIIEGKKWARTEVIAAISTVVSIALFWYTYQLFKETQKANNTTAKALAHQISKDSVDDINRIRKETADGIANAKKERRDDSIFNLQKRSLNTQIDAINTEQKNFQIVNAPYLAVGVVNVSKIEINKPVLLDISISNLGSYPAIIINTKFAATLAKTTDPSKLIGRIDKEAKEVTSATYVEKGAPLMMPLHELINNISEDGYEKLKSNRGWHIYFYSIIKYQNLVNKKYRIYKSVIAIDGKDENTFSNVYNENIDFN